VPTRFAIPTAAGRLSPHFGHCDSFALIDVDEGRVTGESAVTPPAHQPGTFPRFLADQGVAIVLAGGMGTKAQTLFQQSGIEVHTGLVASTPRDLVESYLRDELQAGGYECDHGRHGQHGCGDQH
jgi:predicted Fe-Mo cluster-binding NifX family protein